MADGRGGGRRCLRAASRCSVGRRPGRRRRRVAGARPPPSVSIGADLIEPPGPSTSSCASASRPWPRPSPRTPPSSAPCPTAAAQQAIVAGRRGPAAAACWRPPPTSAPPSSGRCRARSTPSSSTPTPRPSPKLAAIPGVTSVTRVPSYDVAWPRDTPVASGSLAQAIRYLDLDQAADQGLDGTGVTRRRHRLGHRLHPLQPRRPGHAGRLHGVLRHAARRRRVRGRPAPQRRPDRRLRRAVRARRAEGHRRLRLRRRVLAERCRRPRPEPDRLRGPRHPRGRHPRRPQRRRHPQGPRPRAPSSTPTRRARP